MQRRFEREDVVPYFGSDMMICNMEFTLYGHHEPNMRPRVAWMYVMEDGDLLIFATPYVNTVIPLGVYVVYREDGEPIIDETKMGRAYFENKIETFTEYCEAVKVLSEKIIKAYVERTEKLNNELTVTKEGRRRF